MNVRTVVVIALGTVGVVLAVLGAPAQLSIAPVLAGIVVALSADAAEVRDARRRNRESRRYYR